jgi:hypothetical protein
MSPIDQALLDAVEDRWLKVARVISDAAKRAELTTMDEDLGPVAERLKALIQEGRIEVRGNPDLWRHSEVRRPRSP